MPTPKMKETLMFMAQKRAISASGDDMFLWAVKNRDTALAKSVDGRVCKRKWNTYIYMNTSIWDAEWSTSERLYLVGGWFCQKMRAKLSMYDGTHKEFNVFYDFHCSC